MKATHLFPVIFIAIMAFSFVACNKNTSSKANVYVNIENASHPGYALRYVTYIKEGYDSKTGKNILGDCKGMVDFKGLTYYTFFVPRGIWDFYIEYDTPGLSYSYTNERYTINTKDNEWVRISWDLASSYASDPELLQGSGDMY